MWEVEWVQILENFKIWQNSIDYCIQGALLTSDWGKNGVEGIRLEQEAKERMWSKGILPTLLVGIQAAIAMMKNSTEVPQKTKTNMTTGSNNLTPGHIFRQNSN